MRKFALLWIILLLTLAAGCSNGAASPTPLPSPTPTIAAPATASAQDAPTVAPSGPATCIVSPLEFPVNPHIPEVTEADHIEGPAGAPIAFIEYADFQ